jgi:hypothetical protein
MTVVKQLTLTSIRQSSYHYIQNIAELKYAKILYAFHEFTMQKL